MEEPSMEVSANEKTVENDVDWSSESNLDLDFQLIGQNPQIHNACINKNIETEDGELLVEMVKCKCKYFSNKPKRMNFQLGDELYVLKVSQERALHISLDLRFI